MNEAFKYTHNNKKAIGLPRLDQNSFRIMAHNDAAFANNADSQSQSGRIILLKDVSNKAIPILYRPSKLGRAASSLLPAEVIANAHLSYDPVSICKIDEIHS